MTPHFSHLWVLGIRYGTYFAFAWAAVYWRRWQKRRREIVAQGWLIYRLSHSARLLAKPLRPFGGIHGVMMHYRRH